MEGKLSNLVLSNTNLIQIISYERLRIHGLLIGVASDLERTLYIWNRIEGLKKWEGKSFVPADDEYLQPDSVIEFFEESEEKLMLLLEDFHYDLVEENPRMVQRFRNLALQNLNKKTLLLSQPHSALPRVLEKDFHVMELSLPNFDDLRAIYRKVCEEFSIPNADNPDNELIEAALGLTIMEAEKAFALAYVENKSLQSTEVPLIIREKENIIKKSGYLEYYHPKEEMKDVGGLENLKDWLQKRGRGFDKGAKDFGLTSPRGILLLGIPGTGKSLTAKAVGNLWHFPLLRLDMGKIFGGIVGESEKNIREALNIAEVIAPSILWIDEIEKGMSGISSSGGSDGGTTARVLGTFLTWLQEKTKPVFVVATANDISKLPPELLRKGRVDEIFFVDLPTQKEREEIMAIHLKKKNRDPEQFDIATLAEKSKGFSGAELEEVIKEALFQAYDQERKVEDKDIEGAISKTFPLSRTMNETITNLRMWAKSRAVSASREEPEPLQQKDEDTPRLKVEESYNNPFVSTSKK